MVSNKLKSTDCFAIPRVAFYVRCSAQRQADKELSIPGQLDALRDSARARGWEVVAEFIDEAESASTADRPQFQEMMAQARSKPRPFDKVLVWKLSRFSRDREDSVFYKAMLRRSGVELVSLNEPLEDSPAGRMLEGILETVDEFYVDNLSQDTVRGMRKNASLGFHNGGGVPTGYKARRTGTELSPKWVLDIDPVYAPIVQRMFRMARSGEGAGNIASALHAEGIKTRRGNEFTKGGILAILRNEAYTGTLLWGVKRTGRQKDKQADPVRVENCHPALVTREEFEQAQVLLCERRREFIHPRRLSGDYLLSGLIRCGYCQSLFIGHPARSGAFHYYSCQRKMKIGASACKARMLNRERTEEAVLKELRRSVLTPGHLKELVTLVNEDLSKLSSQGQDELATIEAQTKALHAKLNRLYEALEDGTAALGDLAPRIRERKEDLARLAARRDELTALASAQRLELDESELRRYVEGMNTLLTSASLSSRRAFLRSWIKEIEARDSDLYVSYSMPPVPQLEQGEGLVLKPIFETADGREVRFEGDPALAWTGEKSAGAGIREIMLTSEDDTPDKLRWPPGNKQKKEEPPRGIVLPFILYGSPLHPVLTNGIGG